MAKPVPIQSTTQKFTEIADISRDTVMFLDGSCAGIISTSAVNFGLLSEKEQDAIIYAYAGLLNSLSFPVEILVRTQHKDISGYLSLLEEKENNQANPKLKQNIHAYRLFVATTVKERDVLDKKFYIIIPFSGLELGVSPNILFGSRKRGLPLPKDQIFDRALTVLTPKKDHIVRLLSRVGLRAEALGTNQLIRLFFTIYNPGAAAPQEIAVERPEVKKT